MEAGEELGLQEGTRSWSTSETHCEYSHNRQLWEMGTTWDSQGGMLPMSPSDAAPRDVELERRSDMQVS